MLRYWYVLFVDAQHIFCEPCFVPIVYSTSQNKEPTMNALVDKNKKREPPCMEQASMLERDCLA